MACPASSFFLMSVYRTTSLTALEQQLLHYCKTLYIGVWTTIPCTKNLPQLFEEKGGTDTDIRARCLFALFTLQNPAAGNMGGVVN